jgi:hypothetical protein
VSRPASPDVELRRRIFAFFAANQRAPLAEEVGATAVDFSRLQERHALVVDHGGNIVIANPFSGIPTDYVVESGGRRWFANCCWRVLGILAAHGVDGVVRSRCSDCGECLQRAWEPHDTAAAQEILDGVGLRTTSGGSSLRNPNRGEHRTAQ